MTLQPEYDRPADRLGQGKWPASPWLIGALGGASFLIVVLFVFLRVRSAMRARKGAGEGPISSRRPGSLRPPSS